MKKKSTKSVTMNFNCDDDGKKCCSPKMGGCGNCGCAGGVYFLGFVGAAVYFISQSTGFWSGVLGFLKAMVWPAILVYEIFKLLKIGQKEAEVESQEVTE